jgi:hypothetical protein
MISESPDRRAMSTPQSWTQVQPAVGTTQADSDAGKVATERGLIGADDLRGKVSRKPKDEVARLLHRFRPAAAENNGWCADKGVESALSRLRDVDWVTSAESFLHLDVG